MSDSILTVHVLHRTRVLSGIVASHFTNEKRSFGQDADAFGGRVRLSLDLPLDLRERGADGLAGQFHVFAVRHAERVVEGGDFGWDSSAGGDRHRF